MAVIHTLGSLNLDYVYQVPRIVAAGETLAAGSWSRGPGGKGLNQSLAAARAGAQVRHLGAVGPEGEELCRLLEAAGVDTRGVLRTSAPTGHAVIQVTPDGENAIVIHPGANQLVTEAGVTLALHAATAGDFFLTQHETSGVRGAITAAKRTGCRVIFNPAPMAPEVAAYPLGEVDFLVVNEHEAAELSGETVAARAARLLARRHPGLSVVVTAGAAGVLLQTGDSCHQLAAHRVRVVDTTGAGDTFTGYFAAALARGLPPEAALVEGNDAAAVSVTRAGAAHAIPTRAEVEAFRAQPP